MTQNGEHTMNTAKRQTWQELAINRAAEKNIFPAPVFLWVAEYDEREAKDEQAKLLRQHAAGECAILGVNANGHVFIGFYK